MTDAKKSGDPLKYYCIVFALLIVVVGFVWFKLRGQLRDFKAANVYAEKLLTGKGLPEFDSRERPNRLDALALSVDNMVKGYAEAVGGGGDGTGDSSTIQLTALRRAEDTAKVAVKRSGNEQRAENKPKGYLDVWVENNYEETTLENLITLVYNIEEVGRYRVTDLRWQLREKGNTEPPFTLIQRPTVRIGFRRPLTSSRE